MDASHLALLILHSTFFIVSPEMQKEVISLCVWLVEKKYQEGVASVIVEDRTQTAVYPMARLTQTNEYEGKTRQK